MNEASVESFFDDVADCERFVNELRMAGRASLDRVYIALLTKELPTRWLYNLQHRQTSLGIGDYITPFYPTEENVEAFNNGCAELARRLKIYVDTGDKTVVPSTPPAFGRLTHVGDTKVEATADSRDGSKPEQAITLSIVGGHPEYVAAEYQYIGQLYGEHGQDWTMVRQQLLPSDESDMIDAITIQTQSGEEHTLYFDLSPVWPPK